MDSICCCFAAFAFEVISEMSLPRPNIICINNILVFLLILALSFNKLPLLKSGHIKSWSYICCGWYFFSICGIFSTRFPEARGLYFEYILYHLYLGGGKPIHIFIATVIPWFFLFHWLIHLIVYYLSHINSWHQYFIHQIFTEFVEWMYLWIVRKSEGLVVCVSISCYGCWVNS